MNTYSAWPGADDFWRALASAGNRILMLDYDGTLAPFVVERDRAYPYPGVPEVLSSLVREDASRLVIVTGRSVDDIPRLLGLDDLPEIWGSHGAQRLLSDGTRTPVELGEPESRGLDRALAWAEDQGLKDRVEVKPGCLAFHWRGLPERQARRMRDKIRDGLKDEIAGTRLGLKAFDGGLELRVPDFTKADAVNTVLKEGGPGAVVAYMGDDLTDEDAFAALSGRGLPVLVRKEPRHTKAELWLKPPEELLAFLHKWLEACKQ